MNRKILLGLAQGVILTFVLSMITLAPISSEAATPSNVISDLAFRDPTSDFDVQKFLEQHPGRLKSYQFENMGYTVPAAEAIRFVAEMKSIDPRVLLTLLEMKQQLISDPSATEAALEYGMGHHELEDRGFSRQLQWAAEQLTSAFDAKSQSSSQATLSLLDGTTVSTPTDLNAASYSILYLLALESDQGTWEKTNSDGLTTFQETYQRLFGAPPRVVESVSPSTALFPSNLRLPWGDGETWYYTGGPHSYDAGGRTYASAAADFAPSGGSGCFQSNLPVRAAQSGRVVYASCNFVRVDHGGGWSTAYFHLDGLQVQNNQDISAGTALGAPSCGVGAACGWNGRATGSHVHFGVRLNNIPQAIHGLNVGGWTVQQGSGDYSGTMVRGNVTKTASVYKTDSNAIRSYTNEADTDDGRTLSSAQTVGGARNPGTDVDVHYIDATAGQVLTVEMWAASGSTLDSFIEVRDGNNRVLGADDDSGEGVNSRLTLTLSSSGRYLVMAKGYSTSTGQYQLRATLSAVSSNSDNEDGRWLVHDQTQNGAINGNTDEDIFYFNGVAGRIISVRMFKNNSTVDAYLELYSPSGSRLAVNDDGGGGTDSWLVYTLPSSGVYRVKARSYNRASQGAYQARLRLVDANNLAQNRATWASSVESGNNTPSRAFDGNLNTRWSSSYNNDQWIAVDLGANRSVDMVSIRWETAHARSYGIYYWDGTRWRNAFWTNNGNGGTDIIRFAAKTTRYIMVYGGQRATQWGVSIWEVGVYNSATATSPVTEVEDPTKTPDSVPVASPPSATSPGKDESVLALSIGEDGNQENSPEESTWPGTTPNADTTTVGTPIAVIEAIHTEDDLAADLEAPITFIGMGEDTDRLGTGDPIAAYEWSSDRDGVLGSQAVLTTTVGTLSFGTHTISLKVQDNEGVWSAPHTTQLQLIDPGATQYQLYLPLSIR